MNGNSNYGKVYYPGQLPQYTSLPPRYTPNPQPAGAVAPDTTPHQSVTRVGFGDINPAVLCKMGQDTLNDIIQKTHQIFDSLRLISPPNGSMKGANDAQNRKAQFQEHLRTIGALMRHLRLVYRKCDEVTRDMDMSFTTAESLIPLKDGWDGKSDERKQTEAYKLALVERAALQAQHTEVNREIKDILDLQRRAIWELNCQLSMVRT